MNRYSWTGWHDGVDVEPPEPGKEWLTIEEDGEEFAIIVLRYDASIFDNDDAIHAAHRERERRADQIVNALNAQGTDE